MTVGTKVILLVLPSLLYLYQMQARAWCYTENDASSVEVWPDVVARSVATGYCPPGVRYHVSQIEKAGTDKLHIQGYVEFTAPKRLSAVRLISNTAHWEVRKGSRDQARAYCMKKDSKVQGPWELGSFKTNQGARNDLEEVKKMLDDKKSDKEIADKYIGLYLRYHKAFDRYRTLGGVARDGVSVRNVVLLGPPGCGKTEYAKKTWPNAYWKPSQNKWFDGYSGEEVVIFDDFNAAWFPWDTFMRILDRFECKVEMKGGMVELCSRVNVFTTNTRPENWYNGEKQSGKWPALHRRICAPMGSVIEFVASVEDEGSYILDETENYRPVSFALSLN